MAYHIFNDLAKIINGDLDSKIVRVIHYFDLMDRAEIAPLPLKLRSGVYLKVNSR